MKRTLSLRFKEEIESLRHDLDRLLSLPESAGSERTAEATADFGFFCREYFPHHFRNGASLFHKWIFEESAKWKQGLRLAVAAPRGNAKTTLLGRLYPLWRIIRRDTKFIAVISDSSEGAEGSIEVIKVELEGNPRLGADFPESSGAGYPWKIGDAVSACGVKLKAFGSGTRIRGANFMGNRPDLIILDDLENDENVRNKQQRDKLENWFNSGVLKLGPPDNSAQYICIGTMLHNDSLLARISRRPDFTFKLFRALISFPTDMKLWEEWERLYLTANDRAQEFYALHREKMDEGAVVLWPEVQPLYALMCERCLSRDAFAAEMQNQPMDGSARIFPPELFQYYHSLPAMEFTVGGIDLAMGKEAGDYTAIIILGRDKVGRFYVLEAEIERMTPTMAIERIIRLQEKHNCIRFAVEEVAFQEFFKKVLVQESLKSGIPVPAVGFRPRSSKAVRIESLAPHIANGTIYFDKRHHLLLDQFMEYPKSAHDDGPDALHIALQVGSSSAPPEYRSAAGGMRCGHDRGF